MFSLSITLLIFPLLIESYRLRLSPGRLVMNAATVGSANLDWSSLGFEYRQTKSFVKVSYKNGKWGDIELIEGEPYIPIHIGATALHYGQACFEGLKAFQCKDGTVKIFRPDENAKRIEQSCKRICMPPLDHQRFVEACKIVIKDNIGYVPPYQTGGSLYIRPVLFGSGPRIGLQPADEYTLVILVIPVGDYYKGGLKAVQAVVIDDFDRAAPRGVGSVKVAGNYASDMLPNVQAKKNGFPIALYLDAKTNTFVEEFSTSNFIAIDKNGAYVTPKSDAILASITNKSLMEIARSEGMDVQVRPIEVNEVGSFQEVAACGTAVVVTPVSHIHYKDKSFVINGGSIEVGPVMNKLYNKVRGIQKGDISDPFGWMVSV